MMNPARERGERREGGGGRTSALPLGPAGGPSGARCRRRVPAGRGRLRGWRRHRRPTLRLLRERVPARREGRARQRASPFGALPTVQRRFPLILSLERGGRGLTRKPPQPRGYLHGTGGKNSRRGAAARLLFVGGNPPLRARHRSAQLAAARRRRRPRRRRRLPRRLAEWWWCVGVARARAQLPYIPFDPIFLSFPLSQHHLSLTQGLLSNNIANVTSYNMMFGTQTFFTRVPPREMRRPRRP